MTVRRRRGALAGLALAILLLVAPATLWLAGAAGPTPAGALPRPGPAAPPDTAQPGEPRRGGVEPAEPIRIQLPGLGVDAPVLPVGVDERGEMAVPPDVRTVGWYRFGPGPGSAAGSSVLAGHVDDRVQGHGAFYRLAELSVGAPVRVVLADGAVLDFRVREVLRVDKSRLPVEHVFARAGPPRLTLVTCGGEFDRADGHYRDNIVVTAG